MIPDPAAEPAVEAFPLQERCSFSVLLAQPNWIRPSLIQHMKTTTT